MSEQSLKLLSFNCLADHFAFKGRMHGSYNRTPVTEMLWKCRFPLICKLIVDSNADILCLQEVDVRHWNLYTELLESCGYGWVVQDSTAVVTNVVAYRVSRLRRRYTEPLGRSCVVGMELLDRTDGSPPSCCFAVVCVHLVADPPGESKEMRRLKQLGSALSILSRRRETALFVCGDFNSPPSSAVYRFITEGSLVDQLTGDVLLTNDCPKLSSAYRTVHGREPPATYVSSDSRALGTLDYIFHSHDCPFRPTSAHVQLCGGGTVKKNIILPNSNHPSDHLALSCTFELQQLSTAEAEDEPM